MTQTRLIETAVRAFGQKGLAGVSTREIAAAAETQMSAITYHFGGKEGLYLAAADAVADHMCDHMSDALTAARKHDGLSAQAARETIHAIIAAFIDRIGGDDDAVEWSAFVLREQMRPTAAFDRLYDGAMGDLVENFAELVCIATGINDRHAARVTTITLVGQMLAPKTLRGLCQRLLGVSEVAGQSLAEITAQVSANADAILDAMIALRQGTDQ